MSTLREPLPSQTRRTLSLFAPYRRPLAGVLALIGISALLGVASPFLLRDILDRAIPDGDTTLLSLLAAGLIAISVATGALGVAQTYLSNVVGQRVMHDLRSRVYRHLQRLSLAFFTRTRTGEVQSRIANDIGGVQNVVTSTATSIVSNVTTVVATVVAMVLLDWRLAAFSLALLPFFVWLTRRVGSERKRITARRQGRMADMSALVSESLSVSGILLGKTMGRSAELAERFARESSELADLEVRARMAGRWRMASVQMAFAVMPALAYWFAGLALASGSTTITLGTLVAFTQLQTRVFFPIQSLLSVQIDLQTSTALFQRIFEYLDQPVDIEERPDAIHLPPGEVRGEVRFEDVWFGYDADAAPTLEGVRLTVPAGTTLAIVGETGSGKTTLGYLVARLYDTSSGRVSIDGVDVRDLSFASLAETVGMVPRRPTCSTRASARTCGSRSPRPPTRSSWPPPGPRRCTSSSPRCPRATTRWWGSAATASRAARSSASPSRGPSCATRRSCCSTRRRARWTTRPSVRCRRRWTASRRAGPPSRSPIGSRRCATPSRSWCSTTA